MHKQLIVEVAEIEGTAPELHVRAFEACLERPKIERFEVHDVRVMLSTPMYIHYGEPHNLKKVKNA